MKGLLLKDLMNLKKQSLLLLIVVGFYLVVSLVNASVSVFSTMLTVMCAMLPITAMSYDERAHWDRYALTMPLSRRDLVVEKYLLGFLMLLGALALSLLVQAIAGQLMEEALATGLLSLATGLLFQLLTMPVMFKLGVEKGRMAMLVLIFLPAILMMLLPSEASNLLNEQTLSAMTWAAPVGMLALWFVSMGISLALYRGKELQ